MLSVIYIAAVLLLGAAVTAGTPEVTLGRMRKREAVVFSGAILSVAVLGGILPEVLHDQLGWSFGPHWLERTAQLAGALGFAYLAFRGLVLWLTILAVVITYYIVKWLWQLLVYFYSQ